MIIKKIICSVCQYHVAACEITSTGMSCPRCNHWIELEQSCSGVCHSCHIAPEHTSLPLEICSDTVKVNIESTFKASPG